MPLTICQNYSGVVIDQNHAPASNADYLTIGSSWFYQTFRLPANYRYGTAPDEYRYPDLSGFQLFCGIDEGFAPSVELNYTLDYYIFGAGWSNLEKGTMKGVHAAGSQIWADIFFTNPVEVTETIVGSLIRFGFQCPNPSGKAVEKVWYSQPNPISTGLALASNSETPLESPSHNDYSFCFRILSLSADNGTDFLGNPYRSVVVQSTANNTDTTSGINTGYWLSSPQPSQFAVVSNYFDVRPVPETAYGLINYILNPSFEYDAPGGKPAEWSTNPSYLIDGGATAEVIRPGGIQTEERTNYCHVTTAGSTSLEGIGTGEVIPCESGVPRTVYVSLFGPEGGGQKVQIRLGANKKGFSYQELILVEGWERYSVTLTPTENGFIGFAVCAAGTARLKFDIAAVSTAEPYFDGDSIDCKWEGAFGRSGSVQEFDAGPGENTVVIDSVLLDPLTPNIAFSVYYSEDGSASDETTETEWENKLWVRVPKTFIANQRQTYAFPEPITAKFVKIEYSYLQAQSYNPGQNQLPTTYKKFPKWVADFFIAQMQTPQFIANTVGVNYDALDFAYNYYLDDLGQTPASPVAAPSEVVSTLTQFFNSELETNKVDATTLAKINLVMQTYTQPPGSLASSSTLLGSKVRQIALSTTNYPVEQQSNLSGVNLSEVSSLNRDNIVFEQGLPVMYFYLTCRHSYKELTATFNNNRAYFAGVKEVAFIRNDYTTTYDGELYIETGGDDINTELNDFVVEPELGWFTY